MLDLSVLKQIEADSSAKEVKLWNKLETTGTCPNQIAHHTSVIFGDKMFLFGGSNLETEN